MRVLDKYEVIRRIAQGGMGEIFLSRQVGVAGFNRLVILKTLLPELAEDADIRSSFLNEARIGATLNHPNIVAIYEIGEWEGVYFLAMEYVNGGGLDGVQRAAYKKKVGIPRAVSAMIVRDAALGLDHAHAAKDHTGQPLNIVHRDCTPQNIMVRLDGVVKVVDFGIAKAAGSDNRTNAGEVKGKLAYLAPEQIKGTGLDGRCDQFALGVVFWELITGRRLFNAPSPIDIFKKILAHDVPRPKELDPGVPDELDRIVMRMLSQERDQRYPRLADAARDINGWVDAVGGTNDQVSLFIREMIGEETTGRTRDLTPRPVQIQGLVPQTRSACTNCGAKNQAKARFCAECGHSLDTTGEASRKMIAAATGQAPSLRPDSGSVPASIDGLFEGPAAFPEGMTPVSGSQLSDELAAAAADARLTMGDLFGGDPDQTGAMPAAPRGQALAGSRQLVDPPAEPQPTARLDTSALAAQLFPNARTPSGAHPVTTGAFPSGSGAYSPAPGSGAYPAAPGSGAFPAAPGSGAYPAAPGSGAFPAAPGGGGFPAPPGSGAFPAPPGSGAYPAAPHTTGSYAPPSTDIGMARARPRTDSSEAEAWVGRRDVLMEVGRLVREAASGRIKSLVLAGDHGTGRTASLNKASQLAAAARLRVVRARGRHFGPRQPLDLIRQLLAGCAGCDEGDLGAILAHLKTRDLAPARLQRIEMAFGGDKPPQVLFNELVHLAHRQDFVVALLEEARHEPVCLVVDDLHWADAASRRILDAVVSSDTAVPLVVLGTAALRFDTAQMPRMELTALLDAEIEQLIETKLGLGGLPDHARAAVVGRARGNPGFALDLIEVLRFEGAIHNIGGSWGTTDTFDAQKLPPNPTFFTMNRLRALSGAAQAVLKAAACVGVQFETTYVASAARRAGDIDAAIGECVSAQILVQVDHGRYRFTRSVYCDVALMMCEGAELRELHQRLYKAMAAMVDDVGVAADAAGHLLQGECTHLLIEDELGPNVARRLQRRGLLAEAARLWTATLTGALEAKGSKERLDNPLNAADFLRLALEGVQSVRRHQASEAVHLAARALAAVPEEHAAPQRAALLLERARGLRERLKSEDAEQDLDVALELLGPEGEDELRSSILAELGLVMGERGDWPGAAIQLESCIRGMSKEQSRVGERLTQLALAYRRIGQANKALAAITKARQVADAGNDPEQRSLALLGQAEILAATGDADGARACVDAVKNIADAQGDVGGQVRCQLTLVEVERLLGNKQRADDQRKRAIRLASAIGFKQAVLRAGAHALPS